jgi:DNA-binding CsgD family transcriptional regulator/DNA-directed RNA polymerase delta subunit
MSKSDKNVKYSFYEALERVISDLPERSREILKSRYGVTEGKSQTLEEIGRKYKITRERIRQIIKEVFKKIKSKKQSEIFEAFRKKIEFTIGQNNGIIKKEDLLFRLGGGDHKERGAVNIFLESIESIIFNEGKSEIEKSVSLSDFDFGIWKEIKDEAKSILSEAKRTLGIDELVSKLSKRGKNVSPDKLCNHLSVSKEIKKSKFDKWGISHWIEINPKIVWQKTYLVLKEANEPLHYREIARLIDKYYLGKKKTHPQTVHNELIKNSRFVLVGRGIYAMAEWGYKKGTVKDVLEEILSRNQKPMKSDEILNNILKVRQVKKSTVFINLNNFFEKVGKDAYTIKKQG